MLSRWVIIVFAVTAPGLAGQALAAPTVAQDTSICDDADHSLTPPQIIEGCTALIKAAHLKPQALAMAYNNRGSSYANEHDYRAAGYDFVEAVRLDPKDAAAYYDLGLADSHLGLTALAITSFDDAIRLDPKNAGAYNNRGIARREEGDDTDALADFDQTIRLDPHRASAFGNRCWTRTLMDQALDLALADCNEALTLDPNNPQILDSRALLHLRRNELAAALADYNAVLRLQKSQSEAQYGRGIVQRRLGQTKAGQADIAAAVAKDPSVATEFKSWGVLP